MAPTRHLAVVASLSADTALDAELLKLRKQVPADGTLY